MHGRQRTGLHIHNTTDIAAGNGDAGGTGEVARVLVDVGVVVELRGEVVGGIGETEVCAVFHVLEGHFFGQGVGEDGFPFGIVGGDVPV